MAHIPIRQQLDIEMERESERVCSHNLQMYIVPPSGYINLEEMRQWCIDRFKVLKLVELISVRNYKKPFKHCLAILIEEMKVKNIDNFVKLFDVLNDMDSRITRQVLKRNDSMSHFVLRSAFSFQYEERLWFFKHEVQLFKWRLSCLSKEEIKAFSDANELQLEPIPEEEKQEVKEDLKVSCSVTEDIDNMNIYKVYFTDIINQVAKRKVLLKNGIAYLSERKIFWLILTEFKRKLNEGFAYSRMVASHAYDDERITSMLATFPNYITKGDHKYARVRRASVHELDKLSRRSYPLCMRLLHEALIKNHHLTNGGRVQYCLFLKEIGLSLNDTMKFWKHEFTKKINEFAFEKGYSYTIRHLYGKEGKRADYEAFSCIKIQNSKVGLRDNHGCPFKHMTSNLLKETLYKCGLMATDIESVVHLSKEGSYLNACKMYYDIMHNCITDQTFQHPNTYFNCSCRQFENRYSDTED